MMARPREQNETDNLEPVAPARSKRTLALGLAGSLLCYLAHPPVDFGWLAWVGPAPWLLLARASRMPGRRPYLALWLAGAVFWLATIQWIRLPYWANIFGLFFMAAYLGAYLPVFVGLTRVAVHRVGAPLWLAGAVVWTGLEWARARLLTGFLMASLAHTQVKFPAVIQIADLAGEYAVTFLIILVAGAIAGALPLRWVDFASESGPGRPRPRRAVVRALAPAAIAIAATIGYGMLRIRSLPLADLERFQRSGPRLALVQSDMLADWKGTPDRDQQTMVEQIELSVEAVESSTGLIDLIVWPETMFRQPLFANDEQNPPPPGSVHSSRYTAALDDLKSIAERTGTALLVGIDRVVASSRAAPGEEPTCELLVYNSAALVDRAGRLSGTYDKMHLLPFGEYIPLVDWLPLMRKYSPITGNSLWGAGPAAFELDGVVYSPNICYETVLPQLIRRQVVELVRRSETPDVLVNVTNDAWYWGSSELDMHLASGVFRAVEMRTPLVIAGNRGLSAYVDYLGNVVAVTERDRADALVVNVKLPPRRGVYPSFYARWGDWLALPCFVGCLVLAIVGWRGALRCGGPPRRG